MKVNGLIKKLIIAAAAVVAAFIVSSFFFQFTLIKGESMSPAYKDMELNIINKLDKNPEHGDVVAIDHKGLSEVIIKRIAACPGDTVLIKDKKLFVNGSVPDLYKDTLFDYGGIAEKEIVLSPEEYFVIGDNVSQSRDSRYEEVGIINSSSIMGKLLFQKH